MQSDYKQVENNKKETQNDHRGMQNYLREAVWPERGLKLLQID